MSEVRPDVFAAHVCARIGADVAAGIVPAGVPDFSALHDHVDANMYLIDVCGDLVVPAGCPVHAGELATEHAGVDCGACMAQCEDACALADMVTGLADAWLRGRLRCRDCGGVLHPGVAEESGSWRTSAGRYFCAVSASALHYPVEVL